MVNYSRNGDVKQNVCLMSPVQAINRCGSSHWALNSVLQKPHKTSQSRTDWSPPSKKQVVSFLTDLLLGSFREVQLFDNYCPWIDSSEDLQETSVFITKDNQIGISSNFSRHQVWGPNFIVAIDPSQHHLLPVSWTPSARYFFSMAAVHGTCQLRHLWSASHVERGK